MKLSVINGHLTAGDKRNIKQLFDAGRSSGKIGRKSYWLKVLSPTGDGWEVTQKFKEKDDWGRTVERLFRSQFFIKQ